MVSVDASNPPVAASETASGFVGESDKDGHHPVFQFACTTEFIRYACGSPKKVTGVKAKNRSKLEVETQQ